MILQALVILLGLNTVNGVTFDSLAMNVEGKTYIICVGDIYEYDQQKELWVSFKSNKTNGCPSELKQEDIAIK